MTPELAGLEPLFLAASQASGRPWPTDPYMRAHARAVFCLAQARHLADEREEMVIELIALHRMLQDEAKALTVQIEDWMTVATAHVLLASTLKPKGTPP